jgi:hypothetical protein
MTPVFSMSSQPYTFLTLTAIEIVSASTSGFLHLSLHLAAYLARPSSQDIERLVARISSQAYAIMQMTCLMLWFL